MKKLQTLLLSAVLLAGGCRTYEKYADNKAYEKRVKGDAEKIGLVIWQDFEDQLQSHLLKDQFNLMNLYNASKILADRYQMEGKETEADFYRKRALESKIEISKIEAYFKLNDEPRD